jgi:hypothetical protein
MLEANNDNLKAILKSSSIKLIGIDGFVKISMNFMHIVMVDYTLCQNMANMITPMIGFVVVNIYHDYMTM